MTENNIPRPHGPPFTKVIDGKSRVVDKLWTRNGLYYAQLRFQGKPRRFPLFNEDKSRVRNISQAVAARDALIRLRAQGEDSPRAIAEPLNLYAAYYIKWLTDTKAKNPLTIKKEKGHLKCWVAAIGHLRLQAIDRKVINDFILRRKAEGVSNRTANLDVQVLRNLLEFAKREGQLRGKLPTDDWHPLEHVTPKRELISLEMIERFCGECERVNEADGEPVYQTGQLLSDYIKLLAFSGIRYTAGLTATWNNVNFDLKQFTVKTKFGKSVTVDFNDRLEKHLTDMNERKLKFSNYLFPSYRTNKKGERTHLTNFTKTFLTVRKIIGAEDFKIHDLRHFFISWCVMKGVDTRTIAEWVGHADGGVLIGKVYGHLDPKHKKLSAEKVNFSHDAKSSGVDLTKMSAADLLAVLQKALPGNPGSSPSLVQSQPQHENASHKTPQSTELPETALP